MTTTTKHRKILITGIERFRGSDRSVWETTAMADLKKIARVLGWQDIAAPKMRKILTDGIERFRGSEQWKNVRTAELEKIARVLGWQG